MRARRVAPWGAVLVGLLLLGLLAGGRDGDGPALDPDSTGPLGTKALVELVEGLGAEVQVADAVDDHDVALLLSDRLPDPDLLLLDNWVRAGGTLVVTDPGSRLAAAPAGTEFFGGIVDATLAPDVCSIDALDGLGRVDGGNAVAYDVLPGQRSCYGDGKSAFVVVDDRGEGTVVSIGGAAAFTNERLGGEDNALLAAALLAPTADTTVALVEPPVAGTGQEGLSDLVSDEVKLALVQLAVAFAIYALWRAVRLGRPVLEPQPVQIDSSEFVEAVGSLLAERRDPAAVAAVLARDAAAACSVDLGRGRGGGLEATVVDVAARTGRDRDAVRRLLTGEHVQTDDDLVRLVADLDRLRQELRHGERLAP